MSETDKYVDSFDYGFQTRVRFSPPPLTDETACPRTLGRDTRWQAVFQFHHGCCASDLSHFARFPSNLHRPEIDIDFRPVPGIIDTIGQPCLISPLPIRLTVEMGHSNLYLDLSTDSYPDRPGLRGSRNVDRVILIQHCQAGIVGNDTSRINRFPVNPGSFISCLPFGVCHLVHTFRSIQYPAGQVPTNQSG